MKPTACLLMIALATGATAQVPATATDSASKPDPAAWNKEANDALNAENNHDYATAYALYKRLLSEAPPQRNILMQAAIAARGAGHPEEALSFYRQGSQIGTTHDEIPELITVVSIYSTLGQWKEFDQAKTKLRELTASNPGFAGRGYVIDEFEDGPRKFRVLEFPQSIGHHNTRYRFFVVSEAEKDFTPYYDLESDDIDQVFFKTEQPKLAKKGERRYSLDFFAKPGSQALLGFYDGEPPYEKLREAILKDKPTAKSDTNQSDGASKP